MLYLARDIYTRGQGTLLLPAVGAIGGGALLHFAEHVIRGFAAPTVVTALERTANAELVLVGFGFFVVAAITFIGFESPAVPLAHLVVYGYLLVLGTVMLRSSGGQPKQDTGATA